MQIRPSDIRYSQDSISNKWRVRPWSGPLFIGKTLDDICEGRCTIDQIPLISVALMNGRWVTADNRRLWVFKHLERLGKCESIEVNKDLIIPNNKMTSVNGGISVRVRGYEHGTWYSKPDQCMSYARYDPDTASRPVKRTTGQSTSILTSKNYNLPRKSFQQSDRYLSSHSKSSSPCSGAVSKLRESATYAEAKATDTYKPFSLYSNAKNTGREKTSNHSAARPFVSEAANARPSTGAYAYTPTSNPTRVQTPSEARASLKASPKQGTLGYTSSQIPTEYESYVEDAFRLIRRDASKYYDAKYSRLMISVRSKRLKKTHFFGKSYWNTIVVEAPAAIDEEAALDTCIIDIMKELRIQYNLWYEIDIDLRRVYKVNIDQFETNEE